MKKTIALATCIGNLEDFKDKVETLKGQLEDKYDEKSDKWKESEAGEEMSEDISNLEDLETALNDALNKAEDLFSDE